MHHIRLFLDIIKKIIDTFMIFIKTEIVAGKTATRSLTNLLSNLRRECSSVTHNMHYG